MTIKDNILEALAACPAKPVSPLFVLIVEISGQARKGHQGRHQY